MPCCNIDPANIGLGKSFDAWWHQAITWTNVDFSLLRFYGIDIRAISQQMPKLLFCIISVKILPLKLVQQFLGANELI